jgi:two-component system catabolic regulation response regulator CreB
MSIPPAQKILIVEDEPSIADNVVYSLESEGFGAEVAGTGAAALMKLEGERFALVILDVGLPDMSGFEVCRKLQGISDVPVIFLTARSSEVDRVVGLEIGGDDYLCKPFSPRELTARVRAVLRRYQHGNGGGKMSAGGDGDDDRSGRAESKKPVEVDEERCQIRYFGQVLALSRYEFRLLKTMAKHPGRVYSRSQLMEHASEEPDAAMERTVDAHVKSLRAKTKALREGVEPIVTHRGLGYSLTEEWTDVA